MSDDAGGKRLTRRRVLAGVAGAAGVGLIGGAGTRAFLRDTEVVPGSALGNPYQGSHLDLRIRCPEGESACTAEGDSVSFAFEGVDPDPGTDPAAAGATTFCPGLEGGPAWLWLRTGPSTVESPLADDLLVTLAYVDDDGNRTAVYDPGGSEVTDRPLNEILAAFDGGGMLVGAARADDAFGETEERCLELSWSLPERDAAHSEESVEFTLRFAAVQYRTDANASESNPWQS